MTTVNSILPDNKVLVIVFMGFLLLLSFLGVDLKSWIYKSIVVWPTVDTPKIQRPTPNRALVNEGSTFFLGAVGDNNHGDFHGDFHHGDFHHGDFHHGDFHHGDSNNIPSVSTSLEHRGTRKPTSHASPSESLVLI